MDTKERISCPFCRDSFEVLVTFDRRVFVVSTGPPNRAEPDEEDTTESDDRFAQGRFVLHKNAQRTDKEQPKYPPNVSHRRRRDDD